MKFNNVDFDTYFKNYPDAEGYFGNYGGSYIPPEAVQTAMNEISEAYQTICKSRKFISELRRIRKEFQGRPTPISHLARLSDKIGTGVQLYVKREDLNHTGAHKLNHCMGEVLLAKVHGQEEGHRRDRRRAAWRCAGDRRRLLWPGLRHLYGRGGRQKSRPRTWRE